MKTLHTLRNLPKLGGILSRIVFIFCIIGFCGCLAGVLSLALGAETLKFNGETLEHLLLTEGNVTVGTLYAAMAAGAILCAGEAVLSRFAMHYFKRMLADGTPFSPDGAKELMRLGVLTLCIPLGAQLAAGIVQAAIVRALPQAAPLHLDASGSVTLGGHDDCSVAGLPLRRGAARKKRPTRCISRSAFPLPGAPARCFPQRATLT